MILQNALELPGPEERALYLADVCRGDGDVLKEVESLVAAHLADESFMMPSAHPLWDDARTEREGDTIGPFKLLRQLGEGGFGTVYLAEQSSPVRRQVALKLIKPGMDSREIISRFEAERQALAMMDHPHIAKVYDAGTTAGGRPYFVMELVEGVPITDFRTKANLGIAATLGLFADVCAAVQHAHQKGIIHRDLKPANLLVSVHDGEPVVKVIDFGIAKAIGTEASGITLHTQMGRMIGTPQYMSPEQAELHPLAVDTRSDIYSLGVVLHELLTGTTPLDPERLRGVPYGEIRRLIHEVIPPKPSTRLSGFPAASNADGRAAISSRALRGDLDWIVLKALEKDPERRYESAGAFAEDLLRYLQHKPVEARPPSVAYLMQRFARRHRGPVVAGTALLAALMLGAAGTSIGMKRALDAKEELEWKNRELDRQKLELVDHKERLSDLLESNQRMLGEIQRMSTNEAQLPAEFEALRQENQALLDKVSSGVADQERHTEQLGELQRANALLEKLLMESKDADAAVGWARARLFKTSTVALDMNGRGQFYLDGMLIPYPVLLQAFASRPDDDAGGKSLPRRLDVSLPKGAKSTDPVFHSRLMQLAAAADRIGFRHDLPLPREKAVTPEKAPPKEKLPAK
ncbi:protein kinase [Luteolibacter flavescens]|uniref:Protein kinase n=1 Tax=Luteolibacter flavescens TaxID=1859460 RepID=A0ABT3FLZ3_9BACT|nr:serine/threonine-protein kinase [Luteolibacter flavescens]MCW1884271.1 protein kinase [Luteolibacter flavescens]